VFPPIRHCLDDGSRLHRRSFPATQKRSAGHHQLPLHHRRPVHCERGRRRVQLHGPRRLEVSVASSPLVTYDGPPPPFNLPVFVKGVARGDLVSIVLNLVSQTLYVHYRSKVWDHPENFVFSMKTHTFIYQMSCKMYRKYSQDIDKVRNNDLYLKY